MPMLERKSESNASWSTTVPSGSIKSTLPLASLTSGPEVRPPIIIMVKKINTKAVPRFSMMVLAFSRNRPSQEKIDLSAFIGTLHP